MATGPGSPGEDLGTKRPKRARAGSSPVLPRLSIIRQPPPGGLSAPFSLSNDSRSPSATPAHPFSDDEESHDSQEDSSWSQLDAPRAAHPTGATRSAAGTQADTSPTDVGPTRHPGRTRRKQALEFSTTPEDLEQTPPDHGLNNIPPHLKRLLNGAGRIQRRSRRKVEVDTTDKHGRPLSPSDIRRMKRRITNRDSARRMRLLRQAELGKVRDEVQQLVEDNVRLSARLRTAEDTVTEGVQESASWQQLWHAAMAANLRLSERLAAHEHAAAENQAMHHHMHAPVPPPADVDVSNLPSSMDFSLQLPSMPPAPTTATWVPKPSPLHMPACMTSSLHQPKLAVKTEQLATPPPLGSFTQGSFQPVPSFTSMLQTGRAPAHMPVNLSCNMPPTMPAADMGACSHMNPGIAMSPLQEDLLDRLQPDHSCLPGYLGGGYSDSHSLV